MIELIDNLYEVAKQHKEWFDSNHLYYIFTDKGIVIYISKEPIKEGQVIENSKIYYR